ncbi:MAG: NlpC/P60 family protein [Desulfobacteraceae bacterium]|jgi:cell wall-associated NlpC family hydrolase|nr:NlpC/P60 family protein [Desulfobacteraceae bacterium]
MIDAGTCCSDANRFPNRMSVAWLWLMLLALMTTGCATSAIPDPEPVLALSGGPGPAQMLRAEIQSWLGTPHRMGGLSRRGIDCSGLVVVLYDDLFDMRLPRTTTALMRTGRPVDVHRLTAGDLVFFNPATKFNHVGIYLGQGEFVHASASYGVMLSRMDDDFWRTCYLTSRRLLPVD